MARGCRGAVPARSPRVPEDPQVLVEAIVGLGGALLHSRLQHPVAILDGVEDGRGSERGLPVLFLERRRLDRHVAGNALPLERPHDALRPDDLPELAAEPGDPSLVAAVDDPPRATRTEVHLAARSLVPPRTPPLRHVLARAVRLEYEIARRVEHPGGDDLPVRRRRHRELVTASAHRPSPFLVFLVPGVPPGTRP